MIGALLSALVWILVVGVIIWAVRYVAGALPLPEPFPRLIEVITVVIAVVVCLIVILNLLRVLFGIDVGAGMPRIG